MNRTFPWFTLLALILSVTAAHGQKATEMFIPIGKSPGLSGKYTIIGKLHDIDMQRNTLTVSDSAASHHVAISSSVQVWLDRSSLKQKNKTGSLADLKKGRLVEIKFADPERRQKVEWIKVQIPGPGK